MTANENEERSNDLPVNRELELMTYCVNSLGELHGSQLARVMRYLNDRFAPEEFPDAR